MFSISFFISFFLFTFSCRLLYILVLLSILSLGRTIIYYFYKIYLLYLIYKWNVLSVFCEYLHSGFYNFVIFITFFNVTQLPILHSSYVIVFYLAFLTYTCFFFVGSFYQSLKELKAGTFTLMLHIHTNSFRFLGYLFNPFRGLFYLPNR